MKWHLQKHYQDPERDSDLSDDELYELYEEMEDMKFEWLRENSD